MSIIDQLQGGTLSLNGNKGPNFENVDQKTTSNIQALTKNNALVSSQDLISGRTTGTGRFTVFNPPSQPNVSVPDNFVASPFYPSLGGTYSNKGPREGRY